MRAFVALPLAVVVSATAAEATTPAPWLIEFTGCLGQRTEQRLTELDRRIGRSESRALAEQIYWSCESLMPAEMSATDRQKFVAESRDNFARELRQRSKVQR